LRPGISTKRPGSSPATSSDLLAASIIACEVRSAAGESHSEVTPTTAATGTVNHTSGRASRRMPSPAAASTAISLSRYRRP